MNFSFGEVLTRAWQITWRHKNLWLAGIVVGLISFLPASVSLLFTPSYSSFSNPDEVSRMLPNILLSNGLVLLLTVLSVPVYVAGMAVPTLGTVELEKRKTALRFGELIRGIRPFFWRLLGIMALIWAGMFAVIMVFAACIMVLSLVTFGIGALCVMPLFILFIPLGILVFALTEQAISAVVVDDLGFSNALQRAWGLVRKNLGVMALISLIIYLGSTVISMVIALPMMVPMFGFIFNAGSEPDPESFDRLYRNMSLWMLAFSPIYAVLQGILLTFMQAAWTLTYMRLTGTPNTLQSLPGAVEASV